MIYGNPFQGFPDWKHLEVVYHAFPLGLSSDDAAGPRPHGLAVLPGGTVGNWTPNPLALQPETLTTELSSQLT